MKFCANGEFLEKKMCAVKCKISFRVVKNYAALNQLNFEIDKASITYKAIDPRMRLRVYWIFRNFENTYLEEVLFATIRYRQIFLGGRGDPRTKM